MRYPAIFALAGDGISISFPDLPGCISAAQDIAQARQRAAEALALYLECSRQGGDPIPQPSPVAAIEASPGQIVYLVQANEL